MNFKCILVTTALVVGMTSSSAFGFGRGVAGGGYHYSGAGGSGRGFAAGGVSSGPFGGAHAGQIHGSSRTGPGGVQVDHIAGSQATRGPLGGGSVSGGSATRITTPGGRSYTHTQGGGASVNPLGGVRIGGGSSTSVNGPWGGGASVGRVGGVATGPYGGVRVGSASGAVVRSPYGGGAAYGRVGGVAVNGYGGYGGYRVGHATSYVSPLNVRGSATVVRGSWNRPVFTPNWYSVNRAAWIAPRWVSGYSIWRPPVWTTTAAFLSLNTPPVVYDYGSTVVIQDDLVYVDGSLVTSAENYSTQATAIVDSGRQAKPAENDEWQPLGVVGIIQEGETTAQRIFQLATNKDGIVRGNYYDAVADNTLPVVGSVDKKTQRVAWSIGDKKDIVFETGLSNFTKDESTILIHFGKENTQQMIMVRLEEPKEGK